MAPAIGDRGGAVRRLGATGPILAIGTGAIASTAPPGFDALVAVTIRAELGATAESGMTRGTTGSAIGVRLAAPERIALAEYDGSTIPTLV